MRIKLRFTASGMVFLFIAGTLLRADQVEMQNGDRYNGKVLTVSTDTVVLESEVLGKISLPRKKVAHLTLGAKPGATKAVTNVAGILGSTTPPVATLTNQPENTSVDLAAAFRNLGANTNFVRQIRQQMLGDNPAATAKYDELLNGLMSGKLNLKDLRREAKSSADQLRALKRDLGSEDSESLDMYLQVLDGFLNAGDPEPASALPVALPKAPRP